MKRVARIGLDLAKNIFQVHGVNREEKVVFSKRIKRDGLLEFFANLDREDDCIIGMESCCGSDHWARELIKMGYIAKIMNPRFVKPYRKSVKNDKQDAEAICEAVGRPTMRFVPIKTLEQQDMILIHRQREQLMRRRTAQSNQVRGLLMNYGIVIPQGYSQLGKHIAVILENKSKLLTVIARQVIYDMYEEIVHLALKIDELDKKLKALAESRKDCQRLMTIPGVGYMTASAIIAWFGDGSQFKCARDAATYVGLVPNQHSSGNTIRLGRINKRGNRYLRILLVLGAHADLRLAEHRQKNGVIVSRDEWSLGIKGRRHICIAAVALAAKNLRTAWALLRDESDYLAKAA